MDHKDLDGPACIAKNHSDSKAIGLHAKASKITRLMEDGFPNA